MRRSWSWLRLTVAETTAEERVLLVGLALLGVGCALWAVQLGLAVPGAILVAVALGFRFGPTTGPDVAGEADSAEAEEQA